MHLLQTTPPDTTKYFIMGYAVIFGVISLYITSLISRYKTCQRDLEFLENLKKKD